MHPTLKGYNWQCYPKTTEDKLAKQLFKEKHKVEPLATIHWGMWLYVGPIPDQTDHKSAPIHHLPESQ